MAGYTDYTTGIAYRVILGYWRDLGFICATYDTAEAAWHDYRVQSRFTDFNISPDYAEYEYTIERGKPWSISGITVLRCELTKSGRIKQKLQFNTSTLG